MKLYRRENYLSKIRGFYHDTELIKVITGIRRCGKSCLMQTIAEELKEAGVQSENIVYPTVAIDGFPLDCRNAPVHPLSYVAQIPWRTNIKLLDKISDKECRMSKYETGVSHT